MSIQNQLRIFILLILTVVLQGCSNQSDAVLKHLKAEGSILTQVGKLPTIDTTNVKELDAEEVNARLTSLDSRIEKLSSLVAKLQELETPPPCAEHANLSRQCLEALIESDEAMRQALLLIQKVRETPEKGRGPLNRQIEAEIEKADKADTQSRELLQQMNSEAGRLMSEYGLGLPSEK